MKRLPFPSLRRRLPLVSLVVVGLAFGSGCGGDDTVRGAGSIDVPVEMLKFQPTVKGSKASKAAQHP
ncbi:hypothetical protein [Paludisphaera rhizosphaerae]|uniref:hypothetical protein n=1 Tax=Paludisphaera rhizosphaerae TaxID=2711216 RepID=UPI0013E9A468|nr:hypothetical protein [Paludisphaera rhizosphaerae]